MTRIALIDGDSFLYRAGFSVEKTKYLVEVDEDTFIRVPSASEARAYTGCPVWTRKEIGTIEQAKVALDDMLDRAISKSGGVHHFIYISPSSGNFRDSLGTIRKYKGNRDASARPVYYGDLRDYIMSKRTACVARGEEADDMISWVARHRARAYGDETVVVGIDKDLYQIPGEHYDWVADEHKNFTDDEARMWFWAQVLAGDSGDNIAGCWGIGYEKAKKFLAAHQNLSDAQLWPKVVRKFKESQKVAGCPYKDVDAEGAALETARLVRLRHSMDEPLWRPSSGGAMEVSQEETWTPKEQEQKDEENGKKANCAEGAGGQELPNSLGPQGSTASRAPNAGEPV